MPDDWETLVGELKSLRQRRGLSLQSLARCPGVLAALAHPPLQEAYDAVVSLVEQLGEDEPARALRQAYAIGMREPRLLTERRTDLSVATGRDPKTLAGYENQMIAELAARLLGRQKAEVNESQVYVVGDVHDGQLRRISVTVKFPTDDNGNVFERSVDYENRSSVASLPALLYELPQEWRPQSLILGLRLHGEHRDLALWTTAAHELLALMFADQGQAVSIRDGVALVHIDRPAPGVVYSIYWLRS